MNEIGAVHDQSRQEAIGFFKLLRDLATHTRTQVRQCSDYESVIWFEELPEKEGCFSRAWGGGSLADPSVWLRVSKAPEKRCPRPPAVLAKWIEDPFPYSFSKVPVLLQRIVAPEAGGTGVPCSGPTPTAPGGAGATVHSLSDHPHIETAFDRYLDEDWLPWAAECEDLVEHRAVYEKLFTIRQEQLRLGEQLELVLGLGLLAWKDPTGRVVSRHLLTTPVTLDFDANKGLFAVRPTAEGPDVALELDMLEPKDRPRGFEDRFLAKKLLLDEDPWDRSETDPVLREFAQSLHHGGEYWETNSRPTAPPTPVPAVHFAPALILRRRSSRGFVEACSRVVRALEAGGEIPPCVQRLLTSRPAGGPDTPTSVGPPEDSGTYFPLPTNEEQLEVAHRIARAQGLLVQGPPGTGKSHTIANLISHFLATGQRVLVTAQTPRALRVLLTKIPPQLQHLSVTLLGNDRESLDNLTNSIRSIADRLPLFSAARYEAEVATLQNEVHRLTTRISNLNRRIEVGRERETKPLPCQMGTFSGTPEQVARLVGEGERRFAWLEDRPTSPGPLPVDPGSLFSLLFQLRSFGSGKLQDLSLSVPASLAALPTSEQLGRLFEQESGRHEELLTLASTGSSELQPTSWTATPSEVRSLRDAADSLERRLGTLTSQPARWLRRAVADVFSEQEGPWAFRLETSHAILAHLESVQLDLDEPRAVLPRQVDTGKLIADLGEMLAYLQSNGTPGPLAWLLKPRLRNLRYLHEAVLLDGRPCTAEEPCRRMLSLLEAKRNFDRLWDLWADLLGPRDRRIGIRLSLIRHATDLLARVLDLREAVVSVKQAARDVPLPAGFRWDSPESLRSLQDACRYRLASVALQEVQSSLLVHERPLADHCRQTGIHPACGGLLAALRARDVAAYTRSLKELGDFEEGKRLWAQVEATLHKVRLVLPKLAAALAADPQNPDWEDRFESLGSAWDWACASVALSQWMGQQETADPSSELPRVRKELYAKTAELAAAKAWSHCLAKISEHHRQHLEAWKLAVQKIGKGTGKHAAVHRRDAQQHLEECRDAVPAWIMPLHQVFETVPPVPAGFDLVIVDEASQCGLDSLLLLYLGKKLLVVGDDEQISPTVISIDHDEFRSLVRERLPAYHLTSVLSPDTSLFELAQVWFQGRTVLREHFRCMPEIIGFSNDLCYSRTPLIPLRQYPPDRLEPVVTRFVEGGYRQGPTGGVTNPTEARAIAATIAECCRDKRYAESSMGVISLLGESQARLIQNHLLGLVGPSEIERHRIICGDAYSFQGDERDVMFLSLVAAPQDETLESIPVRATTQKSHKQRFNVAMSRARNQVWLFHSVQLSELGNPDDLRRLLLNYCLNPRRELGSHAELVAAVRHASLGRRDANAPKPDPFESWFEVDVFLQLSDLGYRVIPQFPVADYRIDLVVEWGSKRLAIECDGDFWHGPDAWRRDMARQTRLERSGWTFVRLPASRYYSNRSIAIGEVIAALSELGIHPLDWEGHEFGDRSEGESPAEPHARGSSKAPSGSVSMNATGELKDGAPHRAPRSVERMAEQPIAAVPAPEGSAEGHVPSSGV